MNKAIKNYSKHKSVLFHFYVTISAKFQLTAYLLKIRFTTCQIRVIYFGLCAYYTEVAAVFLFHGHRF